jgi:DNA-binding HxlR family transcriptional regulator
MARKRFRSAHCSIAQALDRVGDWWTMLIIRDAFNGCKSFSEFQTSLGVAKNILSNRLSQLVQDKIFERVAAKPGVDRYEYRLTEKGRDLLPILVALMHWGDKWVFDSSAYPWEIVDARDRQPVQPVAIHAHDGHVLTPQEVRMRPGPGANADILEEFARMRAARRSAST